MVHVFDLLYVYLLYHCVHLNLILLRSSTPLLALLWLFLAINYWQWSCIRNQLKWLCLFITLSCPQGLLAC